MMGIALLSISTIENVASTFNSFQLVRLLQSSRTADELFADVLSTYNTFSALSASSYSTGNNTNSILNKHTNDTYGR